MRFIGVARRFSISPLLRISAEEARSILSVDVGAQQKEIHAQYLKKVRLFHPDSPNKIDPTTGELMSDEEKRIQFDSEYKFYLTSRSLKRFKILEMPTISW